MSQASNCPFITVVLPVRNEGRFIRRCLESVIAQDYPADRMEIIVADWMSTDDTRKIALSFQSAFPALRVIDNPGRIVPTVLISPVAAAWSEFIVKQYDFCVHADD